MRYQALIFDFDGTIADTLQAGISIYNNIAAENGFRQLAGDEINTIRNMDIRSALTRLNIPKLRVPLLLAKARRMLKSDITNIPLIYGITETLMELRSNVDRFGILTSNATENVEAFLELHGLRDLFTFISSTSSLSGKSKHLRSIARTFSMNPSRMLYVGDEIRDMHAAKKAGIDIVAVTWGFNSRDALAAEQPHYLVNTPAELLAVAGASASS